jgi:tetratricopeptide (TPR) repeat protein
MKQQASLALFTAAVAFGQDAFSERMRLANRHQEQGRYAEARPLYEKAVEDVTHAGTKDLRYAQAHNNLAAHYHEIGKYSEAEAMYRKAADTWRAIHAIGRLGVTLSNLGTLYRKTGRYQLALETFEEADKALREAYGAQSAELASCLVNWAEAYRISGRAAEAEATSAKAVAISEKVFSPNDARLSHSLHSYATILQSTGRGAEAAALHVRSLAIRKHVYGEDHPYVASTLTALVSHSIGQGQYEDAEPLALQALKIWEAKLGPQHPDTAVALNNLAQVYRFEQRYAEAEPLYRRSIEILEKSKSPEVAKPLANMADFAFERGRTVAAVSLYHRAEEIARAAFGEDDPQTAAVRTKLAKVYESMGRNTEAAQLQKQTKPKPQGQSFRAAP